MIGQPPLVKTSLIRFNPILKVCLINYTYLKKTGMVDMGGQLSRLYHIIVWKNLLNSNRVKEFLFESSPSTDTRKQHQTSIRFGRHLMTTPGDGHY
jgi:hypothetical protein